MEHISIASIIVANRYRSDMGDLEGLAASIAEIGQIQPIVINKDRRLIAGGRRLEAMKLLGRETIAASVFDLDDIDALKVERDENDQRKEPTISERVALAEAIAETLAGRHGGDRKSDQDGNISVLIERGETKDIAAAKAGLGSGKTLEAAQKVVERGAPELVEAMDAGKVTIHAAKNIASLPAEEQAAIDYDDKQQVRRSSGKANARERRIEDPSYGSKQRKPATPAVADPEPEMEQPRPAGKPDESRLYSDGSDLSAWSLSARARHAIKQISKKDPNALAAIESIRACLENQYSQITA